MNEMTNWEPPNAYPGTQISIAENGEMNSSIFYDWFEKFCQTYVQRPLLLIYNGRSTNIKFKFIRKARAESIYILKLPPHTADCLQPLDNSCFKDLKIEWNKAIAAWTENSRSEFIELTGLAWDSVYTLQNIKLAFEKTGMYPPNRTMYPVSEFIPHLLELYQMTHSESNLVPQHLPAIPHATLANESASQSIEEIQALFTPSSSGEEEKQKLSISFDLQVKLC